METIFQLICLAFAVLLKQLSEPKLIGDGARFNMCSLSKGTDDDLFYMTFYWYQEHGSGGQVFFGDQKIRLFIGNNGIIVCKPSISIAIRFHLESERDSNCEVLSVIMALVCNK